MPWTLPHIGPEFLVQACVDVGSIAVAGIVATQIYEASSRERLLTPFIYPLVLVLCVAAYILHTVQDLRYFFDFPSLMFFSAGLYLIYFRRHPALFAAVFLVGTVNRETTLFLLLFYVLAHLVEEGRIDWRRLRNLRMWGVVAPLALCWLAWHSWIGWVFRSNPSESSWRCLANLVLLLWPLGWPQLLSIGCYFLPAIFLFRGSVKDPTLRIWLWSIPAWFAVMLFYGIWIETRIFGELIAYLACVIALITEQVILATLKKQGWEQIENLQPVP